MRHNGKRLGAPMPPSQKATGWSSGRIELEVEGRAVIVGAVELQRVLSLVLVVARFDTTDEELMKSDLFPMVFSTVERYPELSIHPDPIAELGQQVAAFMLGNVQTQLQEWDDARKAVAKAMAELEAPSDVALQEKPSEVS